MFLADYFGAASALATFSFFLGFSSVSKPSTSESEFSSSSS
jgi:hypothetical protein